MGHSTLYKEEGARGWEVGRNTYNQCADQVLDLVRVESAIRIGLGKRRQMIGGLTFDEGTLGKGFLLSSGGGDQTHLSLLTGSNSHMLLEGGFIVGPIKADKYELSE